MSSIKYNQIGIDGIRTIGIDGIRTIGIDGIRTIGIDGIRTNSFKKHYRFDIIKTMIEAGGDACESVFG